MADSEDPPLHPPYVGDSMLGIIQALRNALRGRGLRVSVIVLNNKITIEERYQEGRGSKNCQRWRYLTFE